MPTLLSILENLPAGKAQMEFSHKELRPVLYGKLTEYGEEGKEGGYGIRFAATRIFVANTFLRTPAIRKPDASGETSGLQFY